eukprot:1676306-Pleurochrysis_carterae.AAC.3
MGGTFETPPPCSSVNRRNISTAEIEHTTSPTLLPCSSARTSGLFCASLPLRSSSARLSSATPISLDLPFLSVPMSAKSTSASCASPSAESAVLSAVRSSVPIDAEKARKKPNLAVCLRSATVSVLTTSLSPPPGMSISTATFWNLLASALTLTLADLIETVMASASVAATGKRSASAVERDAGAAGASSVPSVSSRSAARARTAHSSSPACHLAKVATRLADLRTLARSARREEGEADEAGLLGLGREAVGKGGCGGRAVCYAERAAVRHGEAARRGDERARLDLARHDTLLLETGDLNHQLERALLRKPHLQMTK